MSDTAIENLIEDGVGAVLTSEIPPKEKRAMIRALYEFHDRFDTRACHYSVFGAHN